MKRHRTTTYVKIYSNLLRAELRYKDISIIKLAESIGWSEKTVRRGLEADMMSLELVLAIADELGRNPAYFSTVHRDGNKITFERMESE